MPVVQVTTEEQLEKLLTTHQKVVLVLSAFWSTPCRVISPILDHFSEQFEGILFICVDVDKAATITLKYGGGSLPTFVMFKKGEKSGGVVGVNMLELESALKDLAE